MCQDILVVSWVYNTSFHNGWLTMHKRGCSAITREEWPNLLASPDRVEVWYQQLIQTNGLNCIIQGWGRSWREPQLSAPSSAALWRLDRHRDRGIARGVRTVTNTTWRWWSQVFIFVTALNVSTESAASVSFNTNTGWKLLSGDRARYF